MADDLSQACAATLGARVLGAHSVGGGSISAAYRVDTTDGPVFAKATAAANADWFDAEADGLQALARCADIRVPEVLGQTVHASRAFLFLSWIDMAGLTPADDERMGAALASLHSISAARFGWERDNYIGATPQRNGWCDDWARFFRERRLGPQLALAANNGFGEAVDAPGAAVMGRIEDIVSSDGSPPCLLHGDLWSGNRGVAQDATPVLFDPAVHYGDGECDLAMSELFGGFGPAFYAAYHEARPPCGNVAARRDLYRLYHVLNHLNLFGAGYLSQARALMRRLSGA